MALAPNAVVRTCAAMRRVAELDDAHFEFALARPDSGHRTGSLELGPDDERGSTADSTNAVKGGSDGGSDAVAVLRIRVQ